MWNLAKLLPWNWDDDKPKRSAPKKKAPARRPSTSWGGGGGSFTPRREAAPRREAPQRQAPARDWGGGGGSFAPRARSRSTGGGNGSSYPAANQGTWRQPSGRSDYPARRSGGAAQNAKLDRLEGENDQRKRSEGFLRQRERQMTEFRVEVDDDIFNKLGKEGQNAITFNTQLFDAIDADRKAGNNDQVASIRDALKIKDKTGTLEEFSQGMPAFSMPDINGLGRTEKPASPTRSITTTATAHDKLVAQISAGLQDLFDVQEAESDEVDVDAMNAATGLTQGVDNDVLEEFILDVNTRANWQNGGTYEELVGALRSFGIEEQLFGQILGDRLDEADRRGIQVGDMPSDETRALLGLTKE